MFITYGIDADMLQLSAQCPVIAQNLIVSQHKCGFAALTAKRMVIVIEFQCSLSCVTGITAEVFFWNIKSESLLLRK